MARLNAAELTEKSFEGIDLPEPYQWLFGEIEPSTAIFCAGGEGSGKSTFAMGFADALAEQGWTVEYAASEEGHSKTLQGLMRRVGATSKHLHISDPASIDALETIVQEHAPDVVILDSISWLDPYGAKAIDLVKRLNNEHIGFLFIAHLNKKGGAKGTTDLPYAVDIVMEVTRDRHGQRIARVTKNRYALPRHIQLPMSATQREELRENPIPLPLRISLGEILDLHSIRSVKTLNSYVGHRFEAKAARHPGEEADSVISFRGHAQDETTTHKQKRIVELYLDGEREDYAQANDYKTAIRKLLQDHADMEVEVTDQEHARLTLTADVYDEIEREAEAIGDEETGADGSETSADEEVFGEEGTEERRPIDYKLTPLPNLETAEWIQVDFEAPPEFLGAEYPETERVWIDVASDDPEELMDDIREQLEAPGEPIGNLGFEIGYETERPEISTETSSGQTTDLSEEEARSFDASAARIEELLEQAL
jgi:KaiC/GvpD/RAD55 family RecA-like ATPase